MKGCDTQMGNFLISEESLLIYVGGAKWVFSDAALPYLEVFNLLNQRRIPIENLQANPTRRSLQLLLPKEYRGYQLQVMGFYPINWVENRYTEKPIGFIVDAWREDEWEGDGDPPVSFVRCLWLDIAGAAITKEILNDAINYACETLDTATQRTAKAKLSLDDGSLICRTKRIGSPVGSFAANSRVDGDTSSQELFRRPVEQSAVVQPLPIFSTVEQPQPTISPRSGKREYPIFSNR